MAFLTAEYCVLSVGISCHRPYIHPTVAADIADWCEGRPSHWSAVTVFCRNWAATMYDFHKAVCQVWPFLMNPYCQRYQSDSLTGQFHSSSAYVQNIWCIAVRGYLLSCPAAAFCRIPTSVFDASPVWVLSIRRHHGENTCKLPGKGYLISETMWNIFVCEVAFATAKKPYILCKIGRFRSHLPRLIRLMVR